MKNKIYLFSLITMFGFIITLNSCTKDVTKPDPIIEEKITFDANIEPILTTNCSPCHAYGGSEINYSTYMNAANGITSIINRSNKTKGEDGFMPKSGDKLSQTDLDLLAKWKADGSLEK
jgi:hypothetical protein